MIQKYIIIKIKKINNFYKKYLKKKPKFGITGINPHCESFDDENKDISTISTYDIYSNDCMSFFYCEDCTAEIDGRYV